MELTTLRYFAAIAREGHMTRAAERLGVTQPTLSASIRKLEEELGVPLFHRTGKGVQLTGAGEVFVEHAREALRNVNEGVEAIERLRGLTTGQIAVGGGATATGSLFPPVISAFLEEHPEISFGVWEAGSVDIAEAVLTGRIDLGVVTAPTRVPGDGDIMTVTEIRDDLRLIVPDGHPLCEASTFSWADLAGESVIVFEPGSAVRRIIDEAARNADADLRVVMELRSIEGIKRMVSAGIGVGFVPNLAITNDEEHANARVCADGELARTLALIRRRDRVPSPAAARFEAMLVERINELKTAQDPH